LNEHVESPGDPDGVHAAEQARIWREQHHPAAVQPARPRKRKHTGLKALIVLVVIAAAAIGAYAIGDRAAAPAKPKHQSQQAVKKSTPSTVQPETAPTKSYTSSNLSVAFNYPGNWKVNDTAKLLTVTSPDTLLTNAAGAKVKVRTVVTVQPKQTAITGWPENGAVEVLPPYVMTYTQPSSIQTGQSYVTYLGYTQTDGLDAIFVTGDSGYQQNQAVPESDIVAMDPLVSVTFTTCTDTSCATPSPVTLQASAWQASAIGKDVSKLLASLQFQ